MNYLEIDVAELRRVYVKGRNRYLGAENLARLDRVLRAVDSLRAHRLALAKLASKTPQFFNPLEAFAAESLRDKILKAAEPPAKRTEQ